MTNADPLAIGVRQSHASNMPTPCLQELELIEARSHRAWSLERKLPHVLKPLVSADPASYVKTLSEMADLGHGSAEAGTQATEATDLYLPCRCSPSLPVISDTCSGRAKR